MEGNYQGDRLIEAMKRIVLTGAECTGKSTLAQALSGYYGEPWTAEFVRSYVDQLDRELIQTDLEEIFCGQIAAEDAGGQSRNVSSSTTPIYYRRSSTPITTLKPLSIGSTRPY